LIDLWCRDAPCAVHTAFTAEQEPTVVADATDRDSDTAFYDACLDVCRQVNFCPFRFGHEALHGAAAERTAKAA
jgi:hypothetical protein